MEVLATNDGSGHALHVLPHAAQLAVTLDAELTVLRVLDRQADARSAHTELDSAVAPYPGAKTIVEVQQQGEDVAETIRRVADERDVAFIAMDCRAANPLRHAVLGSVTMSVVGGGCRPVLTAGKCIGNPGSAVPYHVVITNDGSSGALDVLPLLKPLLERQGVRVTLLRIYFPRLGDERADVEIGVAAEELANIRRLLPGGLDVRTVVERVHSWETIPGAIVRVASELGASVIAMSTHGHSSARHVFAGSVALGVLRSTDLPVLLARCGQ